MNFFTHFITYMDTQWLILLGLSLFFMLICRTAQRHEGFANAQSANAQSANAGEDDEDPNEKNYDDDEDDYDPANVKPLTTEPDTRKAPKQQSTLRAAPVAEQDAPKAKPIAKVPPTIKSNAAAVKQAFKVEKIDPKKQTTSKFIDRDAILFTPRKMLCMPSTSGFQCLYQ